jgi:hypothetical protein
MTGHTCIHVRRAEALLNTLAATSLRKGHALSSITAADMSHLATGLRTLDYTQTEDRPGAYLRQVVCSAVSRDSRRPPIRARGLAAGVPATAGADEDPEEQRKLDWVSEEDKPDA